MTIKPDDIKKMVRLQLPGWEVVEGKKPLSEKSFRIRPVGGGPMRIAEIKNLKVRVVSG